MDTRRILSVIIVVALGVQQVGVAMPLGEAIATDANRLASTQLKPPQASSDAGSWPNEELFTGSIVAGMVGAFDVTGEKAYLASAVQGGQFLIRAFDWSVDPNSMYYGDQAYALARISQVPGYENGGWRESVAGMYEVIRQAGTSAYASWFLWEPDLSTGIFYLAHHVVASYAVDAVDKEVWRGALIESLGVLTEEDANCPVMALCAATWALATTGPLDDTLIDSGCISPDDFWYNKKLKDLPGLVLSHQVPAGELYEGSFFWRFDHTDGNPDKELAASGYTEDSVFGALALAAICARDPNGTPAVVKDAIGSVATALLQGVDSTGAVGVHLVLPCDKSGFVFAGEMLESLSAIKKLELAGSLESPLLPEN